ncbi:MAG: LysE family transporter [Paracoccaceae bacterium]
MTAELWIILLGWALAGGSPGPATLAISGTSMAQGRIAGLAMASGVVAGSASWGTAAGLGMSALMLAHVWIFELIRYVGAAYLLWLAFKSLRSAWFGRVPNAATSSSGRLFVKGLLLHLTNPKAILGWGAIYAIALPAQASAMEVWSLFASLIAVSMSVFWGYALLFSIPQIARAYARASRVFDAGFGVLFGAASLRILTARITPA